MEEKLLDEYDEDSVAFQNEKQKTIENKKKVCWWNLTLAIIGFISGNLLISKIQMIAGFIIMGISLVCSIVLRKKYKVWPQVVLIILGILPDIFILYNVIVNGIDFQW